MAWDRMVPFDKDGNQLHYPDRRPITWSAAEPFEDTLTYESYERGRSAAYFSFRRKSGGQVTVLMTEMHDIIPHMSQGKVKGTWIHTKHGQNFGTKLYTSEK